MKALLIGAVLVVLLATAWFIVRRRTISAGSDTDLQQAMIGLSEEAVQIARVQHAVVLDYSVESVEKVEGILGSIHSQGVPPLEQRRHLAVRFGAYVGEVIRKHWGGYWEQDHPVGGKGSLPINSRGHQSFPTAWCFKRLKNGPEDNVWHKLQLLYVQGAADPVAGSTVESDQP